MIKTVLPSSLIMFVFRVINHFSVAISQAVMVLAYVIITIRPLVRSATVHTILFNQTFVSVKTEIVQVRYTLNNVIAIIELMVKCQCDYNHLAVCKILSFLHLKYVLYKYFLYNGFGRYMLWGLHFTGFGLPCDMYFPGVDLFLFQDKYGY